MYTSFFCLFPYVVYFYFYLIATNLKTKKVLMMNQKAQIVMTTKQKRHRETKPTIETISDMLTPVTPITPFRPSSNLFWIPVKNNNGVSTQCVFSYIAVHATISITLIVLYIQALTQPAIHANLLCYSQNTLTSITMPCDLKDKELITVYTTSILNIITSFWSSKDYHLSILLFSVSLVFPLLLIMHNLRIAFKQNTSIQVTKTQSLCSSIVFECLNKLCMLYVFACVLFINGLYQSASTPLLTPPFTTMYQQIVVEVDIAIDLLIIANIISSLWTVALQYRLNNYHLFGHHRYIYYEPNTPQFVCVAVLLILGGLGVVLTYCFQIDFIEFAYGDDWELFDTVMDDTQRIYGFLSAIQDIGNKNAATNNVLLTLFYYIYVVFIPIGCYLAYVAICVTLKYYHHFEIQKVILMTLFYVFLCFNGLDMLLITSVVMKYVLPVIWQSVIDVVYSDFCHEFAIIGQDKICDELTLDVMIKEGLYIASGFVIILFTIFCLINDFQCYKSVYSRYTKKPAAASTDSWDYIHHNLRRSVRSINSEVSDKSVDLSQLNLPYPAYQSTSSDPPHPRPQ
eukprot:49107_1